MISQEHKTNNIYQLLTMVNEISDKLLLLESIPSIMTKKYASQKLAYDIVNDLRILTLTMEATTFSDTTSEFVEVFLSMKIENLYNRIDRILFGDLYEVN